MTSVEKYAAHRYPLTRHQAISLWIFRRSKAGAEGRYPGLEVLLQQRSEEKIVAPGLWGNGLCANVWATEEWRDTARRRLREELGVELSAEECDRRLRPIYEFEYCARTDEEFGEWELDQVLGLEYGGPLKPQAPEVQQVIWVDFEALQAWAKALDYPSPDESLQGADLPALRPSIESDIPLGPLAPWTIVMLRDKRFDLHVI